MVTSPTNKKVDKINELLSRAFASFRILQGLEHTITVYENDVLNIISIARATVPSRIINYLGRINALKTLIEDIDFHKKTGLAFLTVDAKQTSHKDKTNV